MKVKSSSSASGCFKWGCFGCLGTAAILIGIAAILGAVVFFTIRGHRPSVRNVTLPLAAAAEPEASALPRALGPGRLELHISSAELEVVAAEPDQPPRIEGTYDANAFALEESFEPGGDDGTWVWRIDFAGRGVRRLLHLDDQVARLRLHLPRDVALDLTGEVGIGQSRWELGGLRLRRVDLGLGTGSHTLAFAEPLPDPLESLRLDGSIGELVVTGVGNASPAHVEIDHTLGEVRIDLSGAWRRDAEIVVRCGIGECGIAVPEGVGVDVGDVTMAIGQGTVESFPEPPEGAPTLHLSITGSIGEVHID